MTRPQKRVALVTGSICSRSRMDQIFVAFLFAKLLTRFPDSGFRIAFANVYNGTTCNPHVSHHK